MSSQSTDRKLTAIQMEMQDLMDSHKAMIQRFESLRDRIELVEDRLAGVVLNRRDSLADRTKRNRPAPVIRPVPHQVELPPGTITQRDLRRLDQDGAGTMDLGAVDSTSKSRQLRKRKKPTQRPLAKGGPRSTLDDPIAAFKNAERLFSGRNQAAALVQLTAFVGRWPRHGYADNALIYIGTIHFRQAQYQRALSTFQRVLKHHPGGNQVPSALLMIGQTLDRMGRTQQAIDTLSRLRTMFPATKAGQRAEKSLERLRVKVK
ncbi:MAG: tetratricopeptide repeat protein [Myxococcota bacterium]|nr:tetratricopeptide repeat protein [Myxococcota bacterium]